MPTSSTEESLIFDEPQPPTACSVTCSSRPSHEVALFRLDTPIHRFLHPEHPPPIVEAFMSHRVSTGGRWHPMWSEVVGETRGPGLPIDSCAVGCVTDRVIPAGEHEEIEGLLVGQVRV